MPTTKELDTDTQLILVLMGDSKAIDRKYPDNEWGVALRHYDAHIKWFGSARLETKEETLRREDIQKKYGENNEDVEWEQWHINNPHLPSIPYNPVTHEAMKQAVEFIKNPPELIRDCLEHLSTENQLCHNNLFVFVQTYAEFIAAVEILYAWDACNDPMANLRKAREKTNKDRWRQHAAECIYNIMQQCGAKIEQARDAFAVDVKSAIDKKVFPEGWIQEEYELFLGEPDDKSTARLRKAYGQNLTLRKIKELLDTQPQQSSGLTSQP